MKARILKIMEKYNLSESALAAKLNYKQQTINNYTRGINKMPLECIERILNNFPDISAEWLLRGEGNIEKYIVDNNDDALVRALLDTIKEQQKKIDRLLERLEAVEEVMKKEHIA